MKTPPTILAAMEDPDIFRKWFAPKRRWFGKTRDSFAAWKVFLAAIFGLPMTAEQLEIFKRHTGRSDISAMGFREVYALVGRRGGKSLIAALVAVYIACFLDHSAVLQPGESAVCMIIASDKRQARVILSYVIAFLTQIPILKRLVKSVLKESVELTNGIVIEIHTADYRAVRGYTCLCVIGDEASFWASDSNSANPAGEILNAVRPSLATTNGLLLLISSAYAKHGPMYEAHQNFFGKEGSSAVTWVGTSLEMNPTINPEVVARAFARDAASAASEFNSVFRSDLESFISRAAVEACIVRGRFELPYVKGRNYRAFGDPSGGRNDAFTMAIGHSEGNVTVLDLVAVRPAPFDPEASVAVFANILQRYHLSEITGDAYSGEWVSSSFARHGIEYRHSEKNRSALYLDFLPQIRSGQTQLLDDERITEQLCGLERKTGRNADIVDHGPGQHDDIGNVVAGVLDLVGGSADNFPLLDMFTSGGLASLYDRAAATTQAVIRDVFGRSVENPRQDNIDAKRMYGHEARLRGLDVQQVSENMSGKGLWEVPATPPCANPNLKDATGKPTKCLGKTVRINNFYRCAQCAWQQWVEGQEPSVIFATRDGFVERKMP
jgi:hypothetical protein